MPDMSDLIETCRHCGGEIGPVLFKEEEAGRVRIAVSHLECASCGRKIIVDGCFDGPWE